ncbi:hypothetical protein H632_c2760p0, partial [Helicosporidium sp. ATCC 50920]
NPLLAQAVVRDDSGHTRQLVVPSFGSEAAETDTIGLMDWVHLTRSSSDLAGLKGSPPRRDIRMEEVRQHRTATDCWTVLREKVYNLTAYMPFHPGGAKILMACAGRDGTALFNKYHPWVNSDFLLAKCLVGTLHPDDAAALRLPPQRREDSEARRAARAIRNAEVGLDAHGRVESVDSLEEGEAGAKDGVVAA